MTKAFARDLTERAAKSFGQGAITVLVLQLGASGLADNPLDFSAWQTLGVAVLGGGITGLASFVTSVVSKARTGTASASLVVAETAVEKPGRHAAIEPAAD